MNHPLLQSLLLPGALALLLAWALSRWPLAVRPATGAALAVVVAAAWLVGWGWPPGSLAAWLPWVALAAGVVGSAMDVGLDRAASPTTQPRMAVVAMLVLAGGGYGAWAAIGLPPAPALFVEALLIAGVACLIVLAARARLDGVLAASMACAGLAALLALSGSLLLAQLAGLLASALGGLLLAAGWRVRPALGCAFVLLAGWGWLALALAGARLTSASAGQLALLALAFAPAALWPAGQAGAAAARPATKGWKALSPNWPRTLATAAATALIVAAVLAAVFTGVLAEPSSAETQDDYYTPDWN
jgi:hypothetical protein